MTYLLIKYLHIIAAVFLFGFGMGSYLYLVAAHRTGDAKVIAAVARMVVRFDAWLTTPAGVLQLLTGYAMVKTAGLDWSSDWLLGALGVFSALARCGYRCWYCKRACSRARPKLRRPASRWALTISGFTGHGCGWAWRGLPACSWWC